MDDSSINRYKKNLFQNFRSVVWIIFIIAFIFRIYGIFAGLPFDVFQDEARLTNSIAHIALSKNPDPLFLNYPSLYIYMQFLWNSLLWLVGRIFGIFPNWTTFWSSLYIDTTFIYILSRTLTAILGALTAVFLTISAKKIFGSVIGALSGLFLAVNFTHIRCSHWVTTDVPATFFIVLVLWATTHINEKNHRWYIWAGIFSGLAAAAKYNAGLAILIPIFAIAASSTGNSFFIRLKDIWRSKKFRWTIRSAVLAFIVASPYTLLTPVRFVKGLGGEAFHMRTGHIGFENAGPGYLYHLKVSFPQAMGIIMLVLSLFGFILILRKAKFAYLWIFPVIYYAIIGSWKVLFQRYTIPLYPFAAIFCAYGIFYLASRIKHLKTFWIAVISLIAIAFPLAKSAMFDLHIDNVNTYEILGKWVEKNVDATECICSDYNVNGALALWSKDILPYLDKNISKSEFLAKNFDPLLNRCWIFIEETQKPFDTSNFPCRYFVETVGKSQRYIESPSHYPQRAAFYKKLHKIEPIFKIYGEPANWWERYSWRSITKSKHTGSSFLIYRIN